MLNIRISMKGVIIVLIAYAQNPPLNVHADVSGEAIGLNFGRCLHLHQNFVYASNEGSDESPHLRRLAQAFATRQEAHCCLISVSLWKYRVL